MRPRYRRMLPMSGYQFIRSISRPFPGYEYLLTGEIEEYFSPRLRSLLRRRRRW